MAAKIVAIGVEFYLQRKASKARNIKRFHVETARPKIMLNTTQEMLPGTIALPSISSDSKSLRENSQMLNLTTNMDSFVSQENSLIFYNNLRPSPARFHNHTRSNS